MKLIDEMPELADEIEQGLIEINENLLANTVKNLNITGRCECGDENCGTFYTLEKEIWSGKKLRQIVPVVDKLYAIDVYENHLACIEILDRKKVTEKLSELFKSNT